MYAMNAPSGILHDSLRKFRRASTDIDGDVREHALGTRSCCGPEADVTRGLGTPTGREIYFGDDEIIVSKTDLAGKITYANEVFLRVAGYREDEVLGQPHSMIRHPAMPRAVFALLWDTIEAGREIFAYVVNRAKNGDHYWVYAHVTPTFGPNGRVIGYHSNRRVPDRQAIAAVEPLYARLVAEETRHGDRREGLAASRAMFAATLAAAGMPYDEFVWTLAPAVSEAHR